MSLMGRPTQKKKRGRERGSAGLGPVSPRGMFLTGVGDGEPYAPATPGPELAGDTPPLGAVLVPPEDGLDRLPQVVWASPAGRTAHTRGAADLLLVEERMAFFASCPPGCATRPPARR